MATIKRNDRRTGPKLVGSGRVVNGPDVGRALTGAASQAGAAFRSSHDQETRFTAQDNAKTARENRNAQLKLEALKRASDASSALSGAKVSLLEAEKELQSTAAEDGSGFVESASESYDKIMSDALDGVDDNETRVRLQQGLDLLRPVYTSRAQTFQSNRAANHHVQKLNDSVNLSSNQLMDNPSSLDVELALLDSQMGMLSDAGIDPAKVKEMRANSRNMLTNGAVTGEVLADPASALVRLTDGVFDGELKPSQKATLINKARARIKAQNQVGASMLKADASDATRALLNGSPVADADNLMAGLQGTKEGAELARAMAVQPYLSEFRGLSMGHMQAEVQANEKKLAAGELSARQLDVFDAQKALMAQMKQEYKRAPLQTYATNVLGEDMPPLTDIPGRQAFAQAAGLHVGRELSPMTREEAGVLAGVVKQQALTGNAVQALEPFADYNERSRRLIAGQISDKEPAMAIAIATSSSNPVASERILAGMRYVKDVDATDSKVSAAIGDAHRRIFAGNPQAMMQGMTAAKAIYADEMSNRGLLPSKEFQPEIFREAMDVALNGKALNFRGSPIIAPTIGVENEAQLETLINNLTAEDLIKYGSAYDSTQGKHLPITELPFGGGAGFEVLQLKTEDLKQVGLQQAKLGHYYLTLGTGALLAAENQPYVIDLEKIINEKGLPATRIGTVGENTLDAISRTGPQL